MYQELLGKKIEYTLFDYQEEKDIPSLNELFNKVEGISITAPYKKHFSRQVNILGEVKDLGIINCIRKSNQTYEATNTDFLVVDNFIKNSELLKDREIVLFGNGSMAEITKYSAKINEVDYLQFSRSITKDFENFNLLELQESIGKKLLVINACSREFNYKGKIPNDLVFWDYNYGHEFHLNRFTQSNTRYIDGIDLLKSQASFALKFWGIKI